MINLQRKLMLQIINILSFWKKGCNPHPPYFFHGAFCSIIYMV